MNNKRIILIFILTVILAVCSIAIIACDDPTDNPSNPPSDEKTITGITFSNLTVDYDGQEHEITVSGTLPQGASVSYQNNKGTNAGTYNATATVTCEGYKTLTLNATLKINKLNYDMSNVAWDYSTMFTYDGTAKTVQLSGTLPNGVTVKAYSGNTATATGTYTAKVTFNYDEINYNAPVIADCNWKINGAEITGVTLADVTVDYDGQEHELTVNGTLPQGANVSYESNKGTNAGVYNVKATITCTGYNTLLLTATLKINKINYDVSNVAWDYSQAYTYDGEVKTVSLTGLPAGITVKSYSNNSKTDAGSYTATATLSYDAVNYNAPQIDNCAWVINKADIVAELSNDSVEYDSLPHSLQVVGNIPSGVTATYYYNGEQVDEVSEVGEYTVKCVLSGKNYNTKELTAKLTIKSTEEQLFSVVTSNGTIYFQNNLDDNKLYKVSGSNVVKISNDIPNYMFAENNDIYYFSTSLFSKVIKNYNGAQTSTLASVSGEYLTTDGTSVYYAVNKLFNTDQNGIYKLSLDGSDAEPVRLVADKAEYLTYADGYIYYSNKSDGGKLYRIAVTANNAQGTQLRGDKKDEKVSYIITDGSNLYFNSTKTVVAGAGIASAVTKYNIANGTEVKLTTDSGKYLTKVGSYIYYINNDKITSNIFGDGIYKVSAALTSDSSMPGTKVMSAADNDGYSSLTSDGTNLYYYRLYNKHFYKNSIDGNNEVDLMANFQVVDDTVLTGYSQLGEFKGEIYFTNPLDNGCLYKYNPNTRSKFKVLADSVSNISFYSYDVKDYMYYSTYILTNYALFRMDLSTNEITKITSKRVDNLIFEGDKIYCVRVTAGNNSIIQMDLDGANEVELYKKANASPDTTALYKIGNTFYFIMNPATGYRNVDSFTIGDKDKTDLQRALSFVIVNNKIYYYAAVGSGLIAKDVNELKVCDLDGSNAQTLVNNVDITYMFAADGKIYYSSKSSQNTGVFEYTIATGQTKKIADKSAHSMVMSGGKLYFLQSQVSYTDDYPMQSQSFDGHLYCYDGTKVTKVA